MFESVVGHKNARNEISVNVAYCNGRGQNLHTLQFPLFPTLLNL